MKKFFASIILICLFAGSWSSLAQDRVVIDQVVAVVGNSAILRSDLFNQQRQLESQGVRFGPNAACDILDDMLYQKLLFNQALLDSVEVSDLQVEQILERRLRFFIQQIGSREQLEAYYGKTIDELKDEFRPMVREQELSQIMESRITRNVRVTPSEVRRFFHNFHPDSIPTVESEMEMAQIVIKPAIDPEEKAHTRNRLNEFRDRILRGESFSTLAILYSEDPGSARRGGELGFHGRGELFTEFEATAFGLRPGEVSEVIETPAGYHIIQLIERRGEQINVRHILLQPKVSPLQLSEARSRLDSIRRVINNGEITWQEAALKFSDDPGKINGGAMINPFTNTTRFKVDEIDRNLFFAVDRLETGQISVPMPMMTEEGQQAFRIVKLTSRRDARVASLEGDYDFIQQLALEQKKMRVVQDWIRARVGNTYVFIHENYRNCNFSIRWNDQVSASK
ncbi:MAG: peptidylprolyl isomerase [Bacteroidales bacterium]